MPQPISVERAQVLADHYHRAAALAASRWQERNRQFLLLVGSLALAVLLTANPGETDSLLLGVLAKLAGVPESQVDKLRESFPYVVLHGLLVVLVFYFMTDVYRLNANIIGNYEYLRGLERDLRDELRLQPDQVAFSRETYFYDTFKVGGTWAVKIAYVLIVGGMLVFFLVFRLTSDWPADGPGVEAGLWQWQSFVRWLVKHFLLMVDVVVGGMTVLMYLAYARLSIWPPRSNYTNSCNVPDQPG
jgi:hypothetical protein